MEKRGQGWVSTGKAEAPAPFSDAPSPTLPQWGWGEKYTLDALGDFHFLQNKGSWKTKQNKTKNKNKQTKKTKQNKTKKKKTTTTGGHKNKSVHEIASNFAKCKFSVLHVSVGYNMFL